LTDISDVIVISDRTGVIGEAFDFPYVVVQNTLVPNKAVLNVDVVGPRYTARCEHFLIAEHEVFPVHKDESVVYEHRASLADA
jgi:hypothetical protein